MGESGSSIERAASQRAGRVRKCILGLALAAAAGAAAAAGFADRLQALRVAVDEHVRSHPGARDAPPEWRKLLWFRLAGDRSPDALVVLRARRDECAAAPAQQPCTALILAARDDGSFRVVTEFTLRVHPVALVRGSEGVRELLYARDTGPNPVYARYRYDGQSFQRVDGDVPAAQFQDLPLLVADDRNMALWADQIYAGRQFPNEASRLAPFRLHFDGATVSEVRARNYNAAGSWYEKDFDERARGLAEALVRDGQAIAAALPWPQTLELRLWSCVDWVVERRFWEVEDRRLGRPGACVEPAVFSLSRGVVKSGASQLDMVRLALLQQVGVAYLLRVAPSTPAQRARLRHSPDAAEARFSGAVAGLLLGHLRQLLPLDRSAPALAALQAMADLWFNEIERGRMRFVSPTPELRDFAAGLGVHDAALQCVRQVVQPPPARSPGKPTCDPARLEATRRIADQLKQDLTP